MELFIFYGEQIYIGSILFYMMTDIYKEEIAQELPIIIQNVKYYGNLIFCKYGCYTCSIINIILFLYQAIIIYKLTDEYCNLCKKKEDLIKLGILYNAELKSNNNANFYDDDNDDDDDDDDDDDEDNIDYNYDIGIFYPEF